MDATKIPKRQLVTEHSTSALHTTTDNQSRVTRDALRDNTAEPSPRQSHKCDVPSHISSHECFAGKQSNTLPNAPHSAANRCGDLPLTGACVSQQPLLCTHTLPQVKFKNRLSPEVQHTGGLGPQHPLIREWRHKKRVRTSSSSPSSLLKQHKHFLSDSNVPSSTPPTSESEGEDPISSPRGDHQTSTRKGGSTLSVKNRLPKDKCGELQEKVAVENEEKQCTVLSESQNMDFLIRGSSDSWQLRREGKGHSTKAAADTRDTSCSGRRHRASKEKQSTIVPDGFAHSGMRARVSTTRTSDPALHCVATLPSITRLRSLTTAAGSGSKTPNILDTTSQTEKREGEAYPANSFRKLKKGSQKRKVKETENQSVCSSDEHLGKRSQNSLSPSISLHDQVPRSVSTRTKQVHRHSQTQTYPLSRNECLASSVASLACLSGGRAGKRSPLTSVPALPLIQNRAPPEDFSSSSHSTSCVRSRASSHERKCFTSRQMRSRQDRCSIVNLRIPFGKVEEWDVPQRVRHKEEHSSECPAVEEMSDGGSGMKHTPGDGGGDEVDAEKSSRLRRLEFIVFSDVPKWPLDPSSPSLKHPLPSTSTLMASIMQPHHSPHHHTHLSHCHNSPFTPSHLHQPHPNPHTPKDHTHECYRMVGSSFSKHGANNRTACGFCSSDHVQEYSGLANKNTKSVDEREDSNTSATTHAGSKKNSDSTTMPACSNCASGNTDSTLCASTRKHDTSVCTAFATGSGTNLYAPHVSATSFMSQGLTSTLRYRHPNTRRGFVLSRTADQTHEHCNHSMSITSYPSHENRSNRQIYCSSATDGGRGIPGQSPDDLSSPGGHGSTPVISDSDEMTQQSLRASARHSRTLQLVAMGQSVSGGQPAGRVVEGGRRQVKKKHSESNRFGYPDPVSGCSSRFHHRLLRLAALVADTLTHEQSKKKHKSSRSHSHTVNF